MTQWFNQVAAQSGCVADTSADMFLRLIGMALRVSETPGLTTCAKQFFGLVSTAPF